MELNAIESRLREIASVINIPQDHINYLTKLKEGGFEPRVIYDIGACVLHWTRVAQSLWPKAEVIAFDGFDKPEFMYKEAGLRYHIGVLSDKEDFVSFYQNDFYPGGNSYYREVGHPDSHTLFADSTVRLVPTYCLDNVVEKMGFPLPDLVKIDVQGAELDIIKGGLSTIKNAKHLIVEMQHTDYNAGAPKVDVTLPFIESLGFKCVARRFAAAEVDADYGFVRVHT